MVFTLSTDDYLGITLVLAIITTLLAPRRCLSWSYTLLACYYGLIALLAQTEVSIFLISLFLLVEDFCQAIIHVIKPLVARLGLFDKRIAQIAPNSANYAAIPSSALVNNQLLDWIREGSEQIWKSIADTCKQELQSSQELRKSYRELATQQPDRGIPDWSLFEMEARGSIAL